MSRVCSENRTKGLFLVLLFAAVPAIIRPCSTTYERVRARCLNRLAFAVGRWESIIPWRILDRNYGASENGLIYGFGMWSWPALRLRINTITTTLRSS